MKKVVVYVYAGLVILLLSSVSCKQKNKTQYVDNTKTNMALDSLDDKNIPVLKFAKTKYDFGTFKTVKNLPTNMIHIDFEFQNIGGAPLVIQKVDVSCGCLSADFPKEPVLPKGVATIKVMVDAQDFTGAFNKTLFVKSNATEDVILLRVVGQVK